MKLSRLFFGMFAVVLACSQQKPAPVVESTTLFGEEFSTDTVMVTSALIADLKAAGEKENVVVEATVVEVCQEAGCWLKVAADGDTIRVKTGHAFELPKDIAGKKVYFAGSGYADTLSVEVLQHYATDAGKSKEQIAAINEPKAAFTFDAKGVKVVQ
jgi:hypothetical protein